jgi:hypothetical protein
MRLLFALALVAALALGAPGCTGSAQPGAVRPVPPRVLNEAELSSALLTLGDLPTGYALDAEPGADSSGPGESGSDEGSRDCDRVFDQMRGAGSALLGSSATTAEIEFTRGDYGPFISQSLYSRGDRVAVRAAFDSFRAVPDLCKEFTETDEDGSFTVRLSAASFPVVGDDSFAIRLDATGTGEGITVTLSGYLVLIRIAVTMCMIAHVGVPGVDAAETERVARAAAARLTPIVKPR